MDELDYSSFSNEDREEIRLKQAGQQRANVWANKCHSLKMFFFGMSIIYLLSITNAIEDNGLSWQLFNQNITRMKLLMVISSAILWRTALNTEIRLLFVPSKAPFYLLRFISMIAFYCFLNAALVLYVCISEQIINPAIFTKFWCTVTLCATFAISSTLDMKVCNRLKYEIATKPEMRAIFPYGGKFPVGESALIVVIGRLALFVFMVYLICVIYSLY